jgi:hypothetical protein
LRKNSSGDGGLPVSSTASLPDVLQDFDSALDEKAEVKLRRDVREKNQN